FDVGCWTFDVFPVFAPGLLGSLRCRDGSRGLNWSRGHGPAFGFIPQGREDQVPKKLELHSCQDEGDLNPLPWPLDLRNEAADEDHQDQVNDQQPLEPGSPPNQHSADQGGQNERPMEDRGYKKKRVLLLDVPGPWSQQGAEGADCDIRKIQQR